MNKLFLLLLLAVTAQAEITSSQKYLINKSLTPESAHRIQLGTLISQGGSIGVAVDGHQPERQVRATYDFSTLGGATGDIGLGVSIPKNAIIIDSFADVITGSSSATATGTIAVKVQNAGDVLGTALAHNVTSGVSLGVVRPTSSASWIKTTAEREVKLTVGTQALTAGKIIVWLKYVMSES